MVRLICLAIGYLLGLFQTSYIISRMHGFDIRDYGSGNAGTTNVVRTMGAKWGLVTFAGDCLKSMLAIGITVLLFRSSHADIMPILKLYTATGVVLGHDFPLYLTFRGGKGVASTVGLILAFDPIVAGCSAIIFFSVFFTTHYVSLGSLLMYLGMFVEVIVLGSMGHFHLTRAGLIELYILVFFLMALCWWRHRTNIQRLAKGVENRTYLGKKNKKIK